MKIAVTYDAGTIFQHFGRAEQFKLYDTAGGEIRTTSIISTSGNGHSLLADLLKSENADALICGGIGEGAKNMLAAAGIEVYGGVSGSADEAVAALLAGKLLYSAAATCSHHGAHEHGECHSGHGGHSCGGHTHE